MGWMGFENLPYLIQIVAIVFLLASLAVFALFVALPVHRLVSKLAAYARSRGDALPGVFKNDADVLAHVFKLLTQDLQKKEDELTRLYEQARERARFMERYSDRLVESVPAAILGFDASGRLASLNSIAETLFRIRLADAMGRTLDELLRGTPEIAALVGGALREGRAFQGQEVAWKSPAGETLTGEVSGAPLPEGEGRPGGYAIVLFDRTPLRRLEDQARMNERLAALVDLSTGLAHQIRNPLSGVLGYTDLILKKSGGEGEITELALSVREDALLLKKVVDDFLEFLRERQAAEKPLFWSEILEEVRRDLDRELKDRSVALHRETDGSEKAVELDRVSAYQAASNLLLNAVEASPIGGRVEVRCSDGPGPGEVSLTVEDAGAGVPDDAAEKIFHPFFTTKPEGRGLGLAVVQRVVQAAHGRVMVGRSALGGAKFTLVLPAVGHSARPSEAVKGEG